MVKVVNLGEPRHQIERLDQILALGEGVVRRVAGIIGEVAGILDGAHKITHLLRHARAQVENRVDGGACLKHQGVEIRRADDHVRAAGERNPWIVLMPNLRTDLGAHQTAHDDPAHAAGEHARLLNPHNHAHVKNLVAQRHRFVGVETAGHQQQQPVGLQGRLNHREHHILKAQTDHRMGEDHHAVESEQRQGLGAIEGWLIVNGLTHSVLLRSLKAE